jgi:hypothetical protein
MSLVIPSEEISHRTDFALLCNERGYRDAVEVGTDQGVFARDFLSRFKGHWLFCVDPYEPFPDFPYDRSGDFQTAVAALMPWHGRFRMVKAPSVRAAPWVARVIAPEFVYIDGSHIELDVAADLRAWFKVLPDHGMLAGHDFDETHPGVIKAVTEFAAARALTVRLTQDPPTPSWYIYKREPSELFVRHFRSAVTPNPHAGHPS